MALERSANDEYAKYGFPLRKMYILTHANNVRAQAFYKKMGCVFEASLKDHYYSGLDEWVFVKFYDNQ
jgi:RimJ/RimL family protein N-acetyltransferase